MSIPPDKASAAIGQHTFQSLGSIMFQVPRTEFSGVFDSTGAPILEQRLYWTPAPVVRAVPGQEFKGVLIALTPPRHSVSYAVVEMSTIALAFPVSTQQSVAADLHIGSSVALKSHAYPPQNRGHQEWLIRESLPDTAIQLPNKQSCEEIAIAGERVPPQTRQGLADSDSPTHDEVVWLRAGLSELSWGNTIPLTKQAAHDHACHLVLGETYRKALIQEIYAARDLQKWDEHTEASKVKPENYHQEALLRRRQESLQRLERCHENSKALWSALQHPTLKAMVERTTTKLLRKQDAIQSRLNLVGQEVEQKQESQRKASTVRQISLKPTPNRGRRMKL